MRLSILALLAALPAVAYAAAPQNLKNRNSDPNTCPTYGQTCDLGIWDCCQGFTCNRPRNQIFKGVRPRASTSALLFADRCVRHA